MDKMSQTTLSGKKIDLYYCIHCPYVGYEFEIVYSEGYGGKEYELEVCPKCGWAMYSDTEVREDFLNSNMYPLLPKKYRKIHKLKEK